MGELTYTNIRAEWAEALQHIEHTAFPTADTEDLYWADELRALALEFPDGGVVVLDGDTPVAMGLGIRIHFDFSHTQHSIRDLVGVDGGTGHTPDGPGTTAPASRYCPTTAAGVSASGSTTCASRSAGT